MSSRLTYTVLALMLTVLPASAGRPDRGIASLSQAKTPFLPKGKCMIGGVASASDYSAGTISIASLVNDLSGQGYSMSFRPEFCVSVVDDFAVGAYVSYDRKNTIVHSSAMDYSALGHEFGAGIFGRKFLPVGNSGRVAFYVDMVLRGSFSQGKNLQEQDPKLRGTYTRSYDAGIGVMPGMAAFLSGRLALRAGLGMLGAGYGWSSQVHNQVSEGGSSDLSLYYTLNPLSLSLGLFYCF